MSSRDTSEGAVQPGRMDRLLYTGIRGLVALVSRTPLTLAFLFCELLAMGVLAFDHKHRRIGLINLRIAFPDQSEEWRKEVLKNSFRRIAMHFVELARLSRSSEAEIRQRVRYEPGRGIENYEAAKSLGRGVMFLTGHIGTWELLPLAQAVLRNPLHVVVRPLDNPLLDLWITRIRSRFGNQVIPKESSLRRILRLFGQDEDVGILFDQNVQEKDGVLVPFFGYPCYTAASPAALALRTKTPVVFAFLIPTGRKGYYQIRFYPPQVLVSSGDREADVKKYTEIFNGYLEEVIRENPDCWLWGHRRFRGQPDDSDLYRTR